MTDDKPTYVYNFLGMESYSVTSDTALPSGKSTVKLDFAIDDKKKLGSGGVATLYINDKKVGSGRVKKNIMGSGRSMKPPDLVYGKLVMDASQEVVQY